MIYCSMVDNLCQKCECAEECSDYKNYLQGKEDAESNELVDDLIKLGYPHNFQHERSDIIEYMYAVTGIIRKAYKIKEIRNDNSND